MRLTGTVLAAWVAFAMVSVSACASSGSEQAEVAGVPIDDVTKRELEDDGRDFQHSLSEDGVLTRAEYDQLAQTYRQCVLEAGGDFSQGTMETAFGTYHFEVFFPEAIGPAVERCAVDYWQPLGPLWSLSHQPTQDQIQAANDSLGACLRRRGVDFPYEHPSGEQLSALFGGDVSRSMLDCVGEVEVEHGMPNFSGG